MKDTESEAQVLEKLRSIIDGKHFTFPTFTLSFLVNSPDFQAQIRQLADTIGMEAVKHPDSATLLKAIVTYIENIVEQKNFGDVSKQVCLSHYFYL